MKGHKTIARIKATGKVHDCYYEQDSKKYFAHLCGYREPGFEKEPCHTIVADSAKSLMEQIVGVVICHCEDCDIGATL